MQQPPIEGAGSELRSDAKQLGSTAANRLHSEVDARKGTAASQAKSVSDAIHNAAGQLDQGAPAWLKSAFQQGADQIQRFAETLEQKDSRQILGEFQSFARERPGVFLGACAAAGFAAARIFKAGGEQQDRFADSQGEQSEPWGSGERFDAQSGQSQPFVASAQSGQVGGDDPLILGSDEQLGKRTSPQGEYQ